MIRVAAYCRVSTEREDQANSYEGQQRYFREYIEKNLEYELYQIYADEGYTGTSTTHRKAFNQMIRDAKLGRFELILTKEISRFARNTLDSIYYTRELKNMGVGVYFVNDNINTLDSDAELRLTILASIAQEESRRTSQRVKWGQKRRMEQGIVFGRDLIGYDVREGKLYRNEEGARIVQKIYDKCIEGKGTYVIARELMKEGIYPKHAKAWSGSVILRILRNEKYCGDLIQKKTYTPDYLTHQKKYNNGAEEYVVIRNHHEAIIDRDTYNKVQHLLDTRASLHKKNERYSNRYCYSGKIYCNNCGKCYVARKRYRKDGSEYLVWRCYHGVKIADRSKVCLFNSKDTVISNMEQNKERKQEENQCVPGSINHNKLMKMINQLIQYIIKENPDIMSSIQNHIVEVVDSLFKYESDCGWVANCEKKINELGEEKKRLLVAYMKQYISEEEFVTQRKRCEEYLRVYECEMLTKKKETNNEELYYDKRFQLIKKKVLQNLTGEEYERNYHQILLKQIIRIDKNVWSVQLNGIPITYLMNHKRQ